MEIYPFDKTVSDVFNVDDINGISADGISIRTGNKVIRLQVTEEIVIDDADAIKNELEGKFMEKYATLQKSFDEYKEQMKYSLREEKHELEKQKSILERRLREHSVIPAITYEHMKAGLSVAANTSRGGLVWSYKTVYAPTHVGTNRIDPTFAKRLVTPVTIEVTTSGDDKVNRLMVRQILGSKKFHHYHSMSSSSDCWGNFKYEGRQISNPDEMLKFCQEVSQLLEVINDMSIGTQNPRGLSRLATIEKHVIKSKDVKPDTSNTSTNSRNTRAGVDLEAQQAESADSVWST